MQQFLEVFSELKHKKLYLSGESVREFSALTFLLHDGFYMRSVCRKIRAMYVLLPLRASRYEPRDVSIQSSRTTFTSTRAFLTLIFKEFGLPIVRYLYESSLPEVSRTNLSRISVSFVGPCSRTNPRSGFCTQI
jgi:hypothetical protein